jgi:peptide/nickel transport system permease protein
MRSLRLLARNKTALAGLLIMIVMTLASVCAPAITANNPTKLDVVNKLHRPDSAFPLGTDNFGRDTLARLLYGGRLSLEVGGLTVILSATAGSAVGLLAGYNRRLDPWLMRLMDGVLAFPAILLAIAIMAVLGPSVLNVVLALSVVSVPRFARVLRAAVLVLREEAYVEAARSLGATDTQILLRHILPNCLSPIIVQATYAFATSVLAEASLSFLGVGAPPAIPSWGNMLSEGRLLVARAPWLTFYPGVAIVLVVLGMNLFGDGLRDALDPRLKGVS